MCSGLLQIVAMRMGESRGQLRLLTDLSFAGANRSTLLNHGGRQVTHPNRGSPQGEIFSPLLSNIILHEADRQWCRGDGTMSESVALVRSESDMVLLARTESEARQAWEHLQSDFATLRLVVNKEKVD